MNAINSLAYGTATVDGQLDASYTCIYNATEKNAVFSILQANQAEFYFYLLSNPGKNFTFKNFTIVRPGLIISINTTTSLAGLYSFVFSPSRDGLEMMLSSVLVPADFEFYVNGYGYSFSITKFVKPLPPPKDIGFGLEEFIILIGNFLFAGSWGSVFTWVIGIIWLWRSMTRKTWIIRMPDSLRGNDYGRWIKEEVANIGGTRYWRLTFKIDKAKTARVQEVYSFYNKEELIAKASFKRINGFWLAMPYVRIGTMKLRPNQYFYPKEFVNSTWNKFKRALYIITCWIPKINDSMYALLEFKDSSTITTEIPFLYLNYAEDRVIELYKCTWEEEKFDATIQADRIFTEHNELTKEEIELIKKQKNVVKNSLKVGDKNLKIKSYDNLDEALSDKLSREELMATHRFKESLFDYEHEQMQERLEAMIDTLQSERRKRVEQKQEMLDEIEEHTSYLQQNLSHYVAKAIGMKSIGAGTKDVLAEIMKESMKDFMRHSDDVKKKHELSKDERIKETENEIDRLKNELKKKTTNDIVASEIKIEHTNSEDSL